MRVLLKTSLRLTGWRDLRAFERATRSPQAVQQAVLQAILGSSRNTRYGRAHGFAQIDTPAAFAQALPINTFNDLSPYVDSMQRGEANVLTPDEPVLFNLTSGTTDRPKYVPLTKRGLALSATASRQWLCRALRDHPTFLDGSIVCISGAAIEGSTEGGIPYGSASGMMYEALPRILHHAFVLPFLLSRITNYELRYYLMARMALVADPSFLVTPNPSTLIRLAETGIQYQEEIIRSTHDGVVLGEASPFPMNAADCRIVETLNAACHADKSIARRLEKAAERHDRLLPSACWQKLRLIGCWLGGSIGFQADKLAAYFGPQVPLRDLGYLASEGTMTIPYEDHTPGGILALHNNYYEFMPADEGGCAGGIPLQCHELDAGKQYKMILTNCNGLYRYDIHDVIEVHGFYHRTPVIAFVRKGEDMLSITGEKLHVNQLIEAFRRLALSHDLAVDQFRAVPNLAEQRVELLISMGGPSTSDFLQETALPFMDRCLSELNLEYAAKRKSRRLGPPCLHLMDAAWLDDAREHAVAAGQRETQYKWRAIATELSDLDARHIVQTINMQAGQR
jgi:hypothetical protein